MSHAATTAATGLPPANLTLDAFGYPPYKAAPESYPHAVAALSHAPTAPHKSTKPTKTPPSAATDDEDVFSLDMVTMDMGFEQAYYMYMLMQQKSALLGVEELQRAQQMEMGRVLNRANLQQLQYPDHQPKDLHAVNKPCLLSPPGEAAEEAFYPPSRAPAANSMGAYAAKEVHQPKRYADGFSGFPGYQDTKAFDGIQNAPSVPHQILVNPASAVVESGFHGQEEYDEDDDSHDELDQFFSNTESNALDKFLDSLASSNLANPLDLYSHGHPASSQMFDLHTIGMAEQKLFMPGGYGAPHKVVGDFSHPSMQNVQSLSVLPSDVNSQLPTPHNSRQVSTAEQGKRAPKEEIVRSSENPKRRKFNKELLSLAQKRLNHSHSEQKRRLLCKQAYERCLRLVTNVDDYKNELVSASALTSSNKNSKRKQINKDGLPNLSKHAALLKISLEIMKIREKNENLQKLIATYN